MLRPYNGALLPSDPVVTTRSQSQTARTLRPPDPVGINAGLSYSSCKPQGGRVLRLIEADLPTPG